MYSVVITAAGSGSRAGLGYNKMLFEFEGQTVLETTVKTFVNNPNFDQIIVTASSLDFERYSQILQDYDVELLIGGDERMDSVANGVEVATNEFVFVHDGARMFLDDLLIERLVTCDLDYEGLALGIKATDTTLLVRDGVIEQVLNRDNLYNMQTPQVVNRKLYLAAYKRACEAGLTFTDEMSLMSYCGYVCRVVESETYNRKLTKPEDFEVRK